MKIECPDCKLTGNIDDATVPATGLMVTCPRCKKQFAAERPLPQAGSAVAMLDACPACLYATFSEEKFAVCPKCGLVVADYQRQLLEARSAEARRQSAPSQRRAQENAPPVRITAEQQRRDEESRRKYGLDNSPGGSLEEAAADLPQAEALLPVLIIGWGTVIVAVLLIVYGGSGIYEYLGKMQEARAALAALEEAESPTALFFQFLLFPVLSILYALVMLVFAVRFMALRRWFATAMQKGAWGGVVLIALMKLTDMIFWCRRASADASFSYYAAGLLGDILMAAVWLAPFLALAEYFNSALYEKIDEHFT